MKKQFYNKVKIETEIKKLSSEGLWVTNYEFWKELWASIVIKEISSSRVVYLFQIKWRGEFPKNFRVIMEDRIFSPTQPPVTDVIGDSILFHAKAA